MVHLSPATEVLARRLAAAQGISLEEAIRQALEHQAREAGIESPTQKRRDASPQAVAARQARIDEVADAIANMPVLDPRSPRKIMDDLNAQ